MTEECECSRCRKQGSYYEFMCLTGRGANSLCAIHPEKIVCNRCLTIKERNEMKGGDDMNWCYRVIKFEEKGEWVYAICEVYYDNEKIMGFSDIFTKFEGYDELKDEHALMAEAFKHPIIEFKDEKYTELK